MIDAHIHLDDKRFDSIRSQLISQAQSAGITQFITPAVSTDGYLKLKNISRQSESISPAYGLHPYYINSHNKRDITYLDQWLSTNHSCALGECGLDFSLKHLDKKIQQFYLDAQIELAIKHQLPLILHARGAVDAVFSSLKNANYFNAMIHSYNGSIEQTKQLLDKGILFSFGGALCHPKAHKIHKLVKYCPVETVMFETDAPDQTPYDKRGSINKPINLIDVIKRYAALTQQELQHVIQISSLVCRNFFKLQASTT